MGEASMRKWLRRARRAVIECPYCSRPLRLASGADMLECPQHGGVWMGSQFVETQAPESTRLRALHMRLRERRRRAFERGLGLALRVVERRMPEIEENVRRNNALFARLGLA